MMRKVSRARSRQTTPWDSREELSPIQHFLQMHYKAHYEARHPQLTETGEVELINSFVPSKCPICGAKDFRKRSHTSNGVQRYQCLSCKKSFLPTTNTIFDEHRISISEWLEYCLNLFRYVSINAASWNNKNAWTTSRFWLEKLTEINFRDWQYATHTVTQKFPLGPFEMVIEFHAEDHVT